MLCEEKEKKFQFLDNELFKAVERNDCARTRALLKAGAKPVSAVNGASILYCPVVKNDIKMVRMLIKAGAPLNSDFNSCFSPLTRAVEFGHLEIVNLLIKAGADVKNEINWPDHIATEAVRTKKSSLIKKLRKQGLNFDPFVRNLWLVTYSNGTRWHVAAEKDFLIDYFMMSFSQAQAELLASFLIAIINNRVKNVVKYAEELKNEGINKALDAGLLCAACNAGPKVIKALVSAGANPNYYNGKTWPCRIAIARNLETFKAFLDCGADPFYSTKERGNTLHEACGLSYYDGVKLLVSRGVPVAADQYGHSPLENLFESVMELPQTRYLHAVKIFKLLAANGARADTCAETVLGYLVSRGRGEVNFLKLKMLLRYVKAGLDVNSPCFNGHTALAYCAIVNKGHDLFRLLVRLGADVNYANTDGITPLMVAAQSHNEVIFRELIIAGANSELRNKSGKNAANIAGDKTQDEWLWNPYKYWKKI